MGICFFKIQVGKKTYINHKFIQINYYALAMGMEDPVKKAEYCSQRFIFYFQWGTVISILGNTL